MRSEAQNCEFFLARLFVDAPLRARFRADPQGVGGEFGLGERALASLGTIDWAGLDLAAASYANKRARRALPGH
jgi:hypothetical protein